MAAMFRLRASSMVAGIGGWLAVASALGHGTSARLPSRDAASHAIRP